MPDPILAKTIPVVIGVFKGILPHAKRLHAERSAGMEPFALALGVFPLDQDLDRTIARLGAMHDEGNRSWWDELLIRFGQMVVQPDLFQVAAVKEWLSQEEVRADLKALAKAHIHGSVPASDAQARLEQAYMTATGEARNLAQDHIEIAVTVMVAGAWALLGPGDRVVVDSLQGLHRKVYDLGKFHTQISGTKFIDAAAKDELERIKKRRFIPSVDFRAEIRALLGRFEHGDLRECSAQVQAEILRWAARLHAVRKDALTEAQDFLDRAEALHQGAAEDVAIVKAWIRFEQGAHDEAIQSLRPFDTPQVRSTKLSMLAEAKGNGTALEWAAGLKSSDSPMFSPAGWRHYAFLLRKNDRWTEAIDVLEALGHSDWEE